MGSIASQSLRKVRALQPLSVLSTSCTCVSCRFANRSRKRWNSSDAPPEVKPKEKPYYITTPIFYVNAAPHIGHLYTLFLTDVIKRWQQLKGRRVYMLTGTDEHGMKIQRAAAKEGVEPKQFCDETSKKFRELVRLGQVSADSFMRTTGGKHKTAVQQFWLDLKYKLPENMGMYKGSHEGWYCVSDECFYPEKMVKPALRPQTGQKVMINTESENEVEWVKEETWFFPLTKYKDALLKFYDENPDWIQPAFRMNEVRSWVENNLEDLSVTRPYSRLSWGIQDPEDSSHTIYVWVDALINYLTKSGYGIDWKSPDEDMGRWPVDLHVIGKDIIRFHAVYWPAMLLSLGLPLPKKILCHNHWTMSNRKMSKSLGNVVNPFQALMRWDVEPLRYFLMLNGSLTRDMAYGNELIENTYQKHLQANIGNLLNRVAKPKASTRWSVKDAVQDFASGDLEKAMKADVESEYRDLLPTLTPFLHKVPPLIIQEMDNLNPGGAIKHAFELLRETNRYLSDCQPWRNKIAPWSETTNYIIFHAAEALRICGILLQPVMPHKMSRLLNTLGVSRERRSVDFASYGADKEYGQHTKRPRNLYTLKWDSLFPPMGVDNQNEEMLKEVASKLGLKTEVPMYVMEAYLSLEAKVGEEEAKKLLQQKEEDDEATRDAFEEQISGTGSQRQE